MKQVILMSLALTALVSCGRQENSDRTEDVKTDSRIFLNQNSIEPFLDISSELRCDALKTFYAKFVDQVMDGSRISNYSCMDRSSDKDAYSVKLEIIHDEKTAVIAQEISGQMASDPEFCTLPFDAAPDAKCLVQPFYFSEDGVRASGVLHSMLPNLREYLQTLVSQPQTKDLAYGMDGKLFAGKWIAKFDGSIMHSLASTTKPLDLWLKLTPDSKGVKFGIGQIVDADVKAFESGKSFFYCTDKDCLLKRDYQYVFNGHRLVLKTKASEILTLYLGKPE